MFFGGQLGPLSVGAGVRATVVGAFTGGMIRGAGGTLFSSFVFGAGASLTNAALQTVQRGLAYRTNRWNPNVVPVPDQLFHAHYTGLANPEVVRQFLAINGVDWSVAPVVEGENNLRATWRRLVEINRPRLDIGTYADLYRQGFVNEDELRARATIEGYDERNKDLLASQSTVLPVSDATNFYLQGRIGGPALAETLARSGISSIDDQAHYLQQTTPLPTDVAISQWYLGKFDAEELGANLKQSGFGRPGQVDKLLSLVSPFDPSTAISLGYRGHLDAIEVDNHLKANGYTDPEWRRAYTLGSRYLPGPADLVTFAVRDVWQADIVERFQYDAEFPTPFGYWMEKVGANWSEDIPNPDGTVTPGVPWPIAYWRAHWQLMSPTQGAEAVHRLRPDRIWRYREQIPDITPYTFRDQEILLKTADYPLPMRRWLAALTFLPLRLADIRTAYLRGVRGRAWAVDQLRDRGYVEDDAKVAVETWDAQEDFRKDALMRHLEDGMRAAMVREVISGYTEGLLDRDGAISRLNDLLVKPDLIPRLLALAETRAYRRTAALYLRQIQREYMDGSISPAELPSALSGAGLNIGAASTLAIRWNALRSTKRRALASGQILALLRQRVLSPAQALQRLTNLGWVGGDALLQIQAVRRTMTVQQQRLAQAQGRQRETRRRQAAATQRQARAVAKAARSELRSLYPRAEMRRWLAKGIATEEFVRARLTEQGWSTDYVNRWIEDAKSKTEGNGRRKKEAGPPGPSGTGTGAPGTQPPGT